MRTSKPWRRRGRPGWFAWIGGKQVRLTDSDDREEATRVLYRLLASGGTAKQRSDLTVREAAEIYLDHSLAVHARGTYQGNVARLQVVVDAFGDVRLEDLRPTVVERLLSRRDRSSSTRRAWALALRSAIRHARKARLYDGPDPLEGIALPRAERRERFLDAREVARLLEVARPDLRDFLLLAASTGARPHILRELEARDVDLRRRIATRPSKGRTYRVIIPEATLPLVRSLVEAHPSGPILRNSEGNPWTRNAVALAFRRLCRRAGIPPASLYAIRHGFATEVLVAGVAPAVAAELLNHKSLEMISRHYNHAAKRLEDLRRGAEVGGLLSVIPPGQQTSDEPADDSRPKRPDRDRIRGVADDPEQT